MKTLQNQILQCNFCAIRNDCHAPVLGEGNQNADIMFVGQNPGKDEDKLGRPFVGAAGQWFERILNAIGHERNEIYITNAVKCLTPGNRLPSCDEVTNCYPYLLQEIQLIKPKIIVPMGAVALQTTMSAPPDIRISEWHGVRCESPIEELKSTIVLPLYHPAVLCYNYERNYPDYCTDIVKLIEILELLDILLPMPKDWEEGFEF